MSPYVSGVVCGGCGKKFAGDSRFEGSMEEAHRLLNEHYKSHPWHIRARAWLRWKVNILGCHFGPITPKKDVGR